MSRRVVRELLAKIDDLELELATTKKAQARVHAELIWKEELCRLMRPTDS